MVGLATRGQLGSKGLQVIGPKHSQIVVALRMLVVLAVPIAMPVLALPAVQQQFVHWLNPSAPDCATAGPDGQPWSAWRSAPPQAAVGQTPPGKSTSLQLDIPGPNAPAAVPRSEQIQQRLRDLGASSFLLQRHGPPGDYHYRFRCVIGLISNPIYQRPFEVTERDPIAAMEQVLAAVECWVAGQQPPVSTEPSIRRP